MNSNQLVKDLAVKNNAGKSALYGRIINGKVVYQEASSTQISLAVEEPVKEWSRVYKKTDKSLLKKFIERLFG